ncbi:acc synthase [Aspergillus sclerotiicarbonarius CBS 121057]|uniref:Acc synthase n=1 Tax=Aspergillus sclerotiicarbonarius (strain CBS 121057 / IBT 28362) TaxID=1448318 RepID=A0A319DW81_ASPSB|nr:acc synthase [Aspergillus sclerotiicarbonarius CBS 121057]
MLSTRGEAYAKAGLSDGYLGPPKAFFDPKKKQGVVSFSNAENFLMHDVMLQYIRGQAMVHIDDASLTYHEGPFGSSRLRTAMAGLINTRFHPAIPIEASHILFANGVTSLNTMCALSLTDPDEGILLGQPIYGSFAGDLRTQSGCRLIYTPFHGDDQFSPTAVARYEEAFLHAQDSGIKVKALLICNPHNPLGRCYPRETLEALLRFCQQHQLHLISDEVYALSVYGDGGEEPPHSRFCSVLAIDLFQLGVDPALVHVLYGVSKDFAMAGLRLGCLITRNDNLLQSALSLSRFHWPSHLSCSIVTTILEDRDFIQEFLRESHRRMRTHRQLATQQLEDGGIPYATGCTAGFFLWIDLSKCLDATIVASRGGWVAELDVSRRLREIGVEMSSGYAYHNEVPGWYRVIFTVDAASLKEGLSRIVDFYHGRPGSP